MKLAALAVLFLTATAGGVTCACCETEINDGWWAFFFDGARFVPRDRCGQWNDAMQQIYGYANAATSAAYVTIWLVLAYVFDHFREVLQDSKVRWGLAGVFFTCGIGHLEGVIAFGWPAYHFFAIWHTLTAVVGWSAIIFVLRKTTHYDARQHRPLDGSGKASASALLDGLPRDFIPEALIGGRESQQGSSDDRERREPEDTADPS